MRKKRKKRKERKEREKILRREPDTFDEASGSPNIQKLCAALTAPARSSS